MRDSQPEPPHSISDMPANVMKPLAVLLSLFGLLMFPVLTQSQGKEGQTLGEARWLSRTALKILTSPPGATVCIEGNRVDPTTPVEITQIQPDTPFSGPALESLADEGHGSLLFQEPLQLDR
jgi:hypothetical protein